MGEVGWGRGRVTRASFADLDSGGGWFPNYPVIIQPPPPETETYAMTNRRGQKNTGGSQRSRTTAHPTIRTATADTAAEEAAGWSIVPTEPEEAAELAACAGPAPVGSSPMLTSAISSAAAEFGAPEIAVSFALMEIIAECDPGIRSMKPYPGVVLVGSWSQTATVLAAAERAWLLVSSPPA